jgi:lipopolysaccharide biosynthesis glycosyltransferase
MPSSYNVQKTHERYWSRYWNIKSMKILHFTAEKPWSSWSSSYVRDSFISQKLRFIGKLRERESWDADMYQTTHNLWKQYYFEARNHSLSKLTFYVGVRDTSLVPKLSSSYCSSLLQYRYIPVENIHLQQYCSVVLSVRYSAVGALIHYSTVLVLW